jgi:hypothetical protein
MASAVVTGRSGDFLNFLADWCKIFRWPPFLYSFGMKPVGLVATLLGRVDTTWAV